MLHAHNPPDTLFPLGLVMRVTGRQFVFDQHDLAPELFVEKFGRRRWVERFLRVLQRLSLRSACLVIVTNQSQLEIATAMGAAAGGVVVVRNGPRVRTLATRTTGRQGALARPRLVFLGSLEQQDGVARLPELLSHPVLEGADLTIVGDGSARGLLAQQFADRGLHDRVTFTGWVPHDEVPALLGHADICIDPAPEGPLNHASTMIKITEYLAAGRPVVAFALRETERTLGGAGITVAGGDLDGFARAVRD